MELRKGSQALNEIRTSLYSVARLNPAIYLISSPFMHLKLLNIAKSTTELRSYESKLSFIIRIAI